ncbi:alpha/beta hydrolase [Actinoalloteichus hymeniacidonis]|uniref:TAP-like protein n=1 Tax=Actinoalloteichus hymeniacidonis TaxID=340345 RepID=A0AAC9HVF5_9PSEU|nr:alpha/beta hydrolase [Actinoalloteichus hymeniacidonis]AOS66040.1 TAP-like protein [Actinoalloteichus hymeniacidonis]MBB5905858.1 pimeloyl-ACP methyl ester carboxylesterase [Actinoalloteichus hymeniacidonis]
MKQKSHVGRSMTLLAALGVAGALVGVPAATAEQENQAVPPPAAGLEWGECPEGVEVAPKQLQCATVPVPLDYNDPDGEQIEIMISKLPSLNPDKRRGVLLTNPGGPGGTGLDQPRFLADQGIPASVLDSYDIIGMDTRGVGHSTPVGCGFTIDGEYRMNIPPYAVDEAAVDERAGVVERAAEQCLTSDDSAHLRQISTANMARDLDQIRAALGEEKASFLGYSYGSGLGAAYASMFPETTDRVVLDSNIGDTHLNEEGLRRYGQGMEQTFPDFANWAAARHEAYGLGSTPEEVRETYFSLAESLDENPVETIDGVLFRQATFGSLYNERSYASLAQIWQSLKVGDVASAETMLAETAPEVTAIDNALTVFLATTCNDVEWSEDVQTYKDNVAADREEFPLFGAAAANILPCAYWDAPLEEPVQVNTDGPENVLVLQNDRDPVTPIDGGKSINEKFGDRSKLVSVDGSGHGVYVLGGNACALNITTKFLLDGTMPDQDVACEAS